MLFRSKKVQNYVKEHKSEFWDLLKMYGPYLFALVILVIVATSLNLQKIISLSQQVHTADTEAAANAAKEELHKFSTNPYASPYGLLGIVFQLGMGYITAAFAISWHRLVLLGSQQYQPMNLFKPEKNEIHFILLMMVLTHIIPFAIGFTYGFIAGGSSISINAVMSLSLFIGYVVWIYLFYKFIFYFPAKAVNQSITLGQSFKMTNGYFWKLFWTSIRAIVKTMLWMVLFMFVGGIAISILTAILVFGLGLFGGHDDFSGTMMLAAQLVNIPLYVYFVPLMIVIGVTVISNYYQHALQNKGIPE